MKTTRTALAGLLAALLFFPLSVLGDPTSKDGEPLLRFGIIADVQYCDHQPAGRRYYRNSPEKLKRCVDDLNTHDLAFTIQLGDFIDRDFESFDRVLPIYRSLGSKVYHVLGNHDFSVSDNQKDLVVGKLGLKRGYYEFALRGFRFLVLDGNDLSLYATVEGTARHQAAVAKLESLKSAAAINAQSWNGGLGTEQMRWLDGRLAAADEAGERVVLFCHFPVFPPDPHNLWNHGRVVETLAAHRSPVALVAGHNHAGNYGRKDGVHYLTVQAMVDTPDQTAYAVAEVYRDRIEIRGVGRVPSRTLPFTRDR